MCKSYNATAGINAGYFPMSGSSDKDPYIRIDGKTVQEGHLGVNQIFTNSALLIHNNVAIVRKFTESGTILNLVAASIPVPVAENVIVCGPILVKDGVLEELSTTSSHNTSSTARTGLGVTADGKRVFMVVVDTGGDVKGVTTPQLAKILQALGTVNAMNFDGGGSSTMFVKDQGINGLVNLPYGSSTQRKVRSVIYVR
jgi:exopolysaccharide biosynthesis protein